MPANDRRIDTKVVENIDAILALQDEADKQLSRHHLVLERVIRAFGSPRTVVYVIVVVVTWCVANVALPTTKAPDPPPFSFLQGAITFAALLIATMILAVQNMQARRDLQRSHLDLQINLVAEQKIAKLIALVEELRRDLPMVQHRRDSAADAMAEPVDPHAVASALDQRPHER